MLFYFILIKLSFFKINLFFITILYFFSYIFLFIFPVSPVSFLCLIPTKCNLIIVTTQLIEFFAILSSFLPDLF